MIPTDEIISMAKQCGMAPDKYGLFHNIEESEDGADLESFAALVSARAAAIEREACAKVCEDEADRKDEQRALINDSDKADDMITCHALACQSIALGDIADKIRARGD